MTDAWVSVQLYSVHLEVWQAQNVLYTSPVSVQLYSVHLEVWQAQTVLYTSPVSVQLYSVHLEVWQAQTVLYTSPVRGGAGVKFVDLRISSMMAEETQHFILVSVGFTKLWRRKTKVILNGSMNIEYLNIVFIFYSLMDPTACLKNL